MIQGAEDFTNKEELRDVSFQIHKDIVECGQLVGGENGIGTTFSALRILNNRSYSHMLVIP